MCIIKVYDRYIGDDQNVFSGYPDVDVDGQQKQGAGCKTLLRLWDLNWGVVCISALARLEYIGFTQKDTLNIGTQSVYCTDHNTDRYAHSCVHPVYTVRSIDRYTGCRQKNKQPKKGSLCLTDRTQQSHTGCRSITPLLIYIQG